MPEKKPKPKKKATPKKKVTLDIVLEEIKKIYKRLDEMEGDILALRGIARPKTSQPEEEIETRCDFLTSI
jgi:transposase